MPHAYSYCYGEPLLVHCLLFIINFVTKAGHIYPLNEPGYVVTEEHLNLCPHRPHIATSVRLLYIDLFLCIRRTDVSMTSQSRGSCIADDAFREYHHSVLGSTVSTADCNVSSTFTY